MNIVGYKFWHPSKLVKKGRNSYAVSLGYTDDFIFRLKKYGNGRYNKYDVIDEKEITGKEFEEAFGVMDSNIKPPEFDESYLIVEEPKKVDIEVKIPKELLNER